MQQKRQMSESMILGVVLTLAGGFQDAYSYNGRGGVFANAQTGNIVLLGQNLAMGRWETALHYLFPLLSFLLGVFAAEWIRSLCERVRVLHWRQVILLAEIVLLVLAGLFPDISASKEIIPEKGSNELSIYTSKIKNENGKYTEYKNRV